MKVDGKVVEQLKFDVTGSENFKSGNRAAQAHHWTLSPEFELALDLYQGKEVVLDDCPCRRHGFLKSDCSGCLQATRCRSEGRKSDRRTACAIQAPRSPN
ncbi:MAG: hypothetical protein GY822_27840 [Deltaproteobacteria bacterium]|nr:hypothetical protein [Deltaproteobacteria bacterium]